MAARAGLGAELLSPLPDPLRVGAGTAFLAHGRCAGGAGALTVELEGEQHAAAVGPAEGGSGCTFWAIVPVRSSRQARMAEVALAAWPESPGEGARTARDVLGSMSIEPDPLAASPLSPPPGWPDGSRGVAICMATHAPDMELFERQVESIREQTHRDWVCVVSDDGTEPGRLAEIERVVGGDSRFLISVNEEPLGFYRNFERALCLAPADAPYLALSDQDDRWHPEKLETLLDALDDRSLLVHCDMRVVDRAGKVLRGSYWHRPREATPGLAGLIGANAVTGAASLFPRRLLAEALPFPPPRGFAFHDHWLALVAGAHDGIRFVEQPLQDYVQHPGSALGHELHKPRRGPRSLRRRLREAPLEAPMMFFEHYGPRAVFCAALLTRSGKSLPARARRTLRRFADAPRRAPALAWLLAWSLPRLAARGERAGQIRALARAAAWAQLAGRRGR